MAEEHEAPEGSRETGPSAEPSFLTDTAGGRLLGALVSPVATFHSIRRRPTWVVALVVLTVAALASQVAIYSRMDLRQTLEQQIAAQGQEMTEAQLDQMETFARWSPACNTILVPLGYAVLALLLLVLVNLVGGDLTFHQGMSLALHGLMPWLVATLLTVVVALGRTEIDPAQLQEQGGILASSLAFLAPEDASPLAITLLSAVDVFSIWSAVLLVLGLAIVGGISTGAAVAMVATLWVLWLGLRTTMVALSGSLGGGGG